MLVNIFNLTFLQSTLFKSLYLSAFRNILYCTLSIIKGEVHPKRKKKFGHHFIYPYIVPNLYEFRSSVEHKRIYFKEYW